MVTKILILHSTKIQIDVYPVDFEDGIVCYEWGIWGGGYYLGKKLNNRRKPQWGTLTEIFRIRVGGAKIACSATLHDLCPQKLNIS